MRAPNERQPTRSLYRIRGHRPMQLGVCTIVCRVQRSAMHMYTTAIRKRTGVARNDAEHGNEASMQEA